MADVGRARSVRMNLDLDARYRLYVGWCAQIGVPSADFETWVKTVEGYRILPAPGGNLSEIVFG